MLLKIFMWSCTDKSTCKALEDLSNLLSYLKVWSIESNVTIDVLMPPSETYYTGVFFQVINFILFFLLWIHDFTML